MSVMVLDRLDPAERIELTVPHGLTLAEIVALAVPDPAVRPWARVLIVGPARQHVVPAAAWHRVRPHPCTQVVVRVLPGDTGALRAALMITVAVAALAVSGGALGTLVPSLSGLLGAGTLGASIAGAAVAVGGALLINTLVPLKAAGTTAQDPDTYSVNGFSNELRRGGVVPSLLGQMRFAPPFGALPYTSEISTRRYVTAIFLLGYGPLDYDIDDIWIGSTPLADYKGVSVQIRRGYPGDAPLTLYDRQVIEAPLSINMTYKLGAQSQYTATDVDAFEVAVTFAQGLCAITETNPPKKVSAYIVFALRWRRVGTDDWVSRSVVFTGRRLQPLVFSERVDGLERGQYEVEVQRTSGDYDELDPEVLGLQVTSRSDWTALRSFRPEYPINMDGTPLAVIALRVRAQEQLNGTLDNVTVFARRLLPDWDGESWVRRATRNPASAFRHVMTSAYETVYPLSPSDLQAVEDWHDFCAAKGLTYDRVHDAEASQLDVLLDICAAGRAAPQDTGEMWTVVIDRIVSTVRAHVTARNSWGFRGRRTFAAMPDGFRVQFADETNDHRDAERVVPFPGFVGAPVITEDLPLPGVTSPDAVYREARRRGYEAQYRRDEYEVQQDWEQLTVRRGDLVRASHYVLSREHVSARVRAVAGASITIDEDVTMLEGHAYGLRARLADGADHVYEVAPVAGTTRTLTLAVDGEMPLPAVGDLVAFGPASEETIPALVKSVKPAENATATLTLIDYAPEISALADGETAPAWDGRVGAIIGESTVAPGVPTISSVVSGILAGMAAAVLVYLDAGAGDVVPARYEVDHRLSGAATWDTVTVAAGAGAARIEGYAHGDEIELTARAVSAAGVDSAATDILTHVVGATDPSMQDVAGFSAAWTGSAWRFTWTLESLGSDMVAAAGVKIRYAETGGGPAPAWADMSDLHTGLLTTSPWELSLPPAGPEYAFAACAVSAAGAYGAPLVAVI